MIPVKEEEITPTIRLSSEIPSVNLENLCDYLKGNGHEAYFANPDRPCRIIVIWRNNKIVIRRGRIEAVSRLSLKEEIKEDIRNLVDDIHRFVDEDIGALKRDLGMK